MTDQTTAPDIIEHETQTVRRLAGLAPDAPVTLDDGGWDSRVYTFKDNGYFIKFPRSEKIRGRYGAQIAALKLLADMDLPVVAPRVIWEHPENHYFGYEGVPGTPLTKAVTTMDDAEKCRVGGLLGRFLRQLHPLELAGARNLDVEAELAQNQRWFENGLPGNLGYFSDAEQTRLRQLVYEEWPHRIAELGSEQALCHGDFHFNNIFYGDDGTVGVIDFGDICTADRSKDFTDFDDPVVFDAALEAYGQSNDTMRQKISLREDMTRVITLTARIAKGDLAGAERTAALIRRSIL